jgi:NDP-sugar pyrophosphorylase family protein
MKGMILAAGYGTRMGPISRYLAKPAVPFLGVPMIEHSIGVLRAGGVRDIVINLHHLPESLQNLLGDGSRFGVKITWSTEDPILGSGGGIGKVRQFFANETFVVLNSDVLIDIDLAQVIESHRQANAAATLLLRPDPAGDYGTVLVDDDLRVRKIEGNPQEVEFSGGQSYMFAGLHVIEPRWFAYTPNRPAYESFPDVYGPMIAAGEHIHAHVYSGRWVDLGSARRLLRATLNELPGNMIPTAAKIGAGTEIHGSVLTANTTVGNKCALDGVIALAAATIGDGCRLTNCILCPGAVVAPGTRAEEMIFYVSESMPLKEVRD